ncbi:MAG: hypothetical protein AB7E85_02560 [Pseudobdellovibrionaceae bacterium]
MSKDKDIPTIKPSREAILAQARANAAHARAAIGEENLQKLAAQIMGKPKEPSPMEQAIKILKTMDQDKLGDHLLAMIRERSH